MISLVGSMYRVSYDEDTGEHKVFTRNSGGYNDVTDSLTNDEKDQLINDLVYAIYDLVNNK